MNLSKGISVFLLLFDWFLNLIEIDMLLAFGGKFRVLKCWLGFVEMTIRMGGT